MLPQRRDSASVTRRSLFAALPAFALLPALLPKKAKAAAVPKPQGLELLLQQRLEYARRQAFFWRYRLGVTASPTRAQIEQLFAAAVSDVTVDPSSAWIPAAGAIDRSDAQPKAYLRKPVAEMCSSELLSLAAEVLGVSPDAYRENDAAFYAIHDGANRPHFTDLQAGKLMLWSAQLNHLSGVVVFSDVFTCGEAVAPAPSLSAG